MRLLLLAACFALAGAEAAPAYAARTHDAILAARPLTAKHTAATRTAPSDGVLVSPRVVRSTLAALVTMIVTSTVLSADSTASLRAALTSAGLAPLAGALGAIASGCDSLRSRHALTFVLAHSAITYATGDALAQLGRRPPAPPPRAPASPTRASRFRRRAQPGPPTPLEACETRAPVRMHPLRAVRTGGLGIVADALPFLLWARALQHLEGTPIGAAAAAAGLLLPLKIVLHVVFFQARAPRRMSRPTSATNYLGGCLARRPFRTRCTSAVSPSSAATAPLPRSPHSAARCCARAS